MVVSLIAHGNLPRLHQLIYLIADVVAKVGDVTLVGTEIQKVEP